MTEAESERDILAAVFPYEVAIVGESAVQHLVQRSADDRSISIDVGHDLSIKPVFSLLKAALETIRQIKKIIREKFPKETQDKYSVKIDKNVIDLVTSDPAIKKAMADALPKLIEACLRDAQKKPSK